MKIPGLYRLMRGIIGVGLGFYFRRIERFHPERVPATGPVLFTSNHPNSLTDSFVIGAAVPRKVNFVGTVQLFQFKPLKWLLSNCGVIPINRLKDDPRSMRTVADTFEAVYRVLEHGEAVGIFPEGITHDDPQLKTVKTGAARMALELEHRHGGKLGLQVVPVGLNLSAKNKYRSEVLVNFGPAIRAADFLGGYTEHKKECINALNAEIEKNIQQLILHIPQLEQVRVVEAVKRLYLEKLRVANRVVSEPIARDAEDLRLAQTIAAAVAQVYREQPERAAAFARKLHLYESWLARLRLSDEAVAQMGDKSKESSAAALPYQDRLLVGRVFWRAGLAILGAPIAVYGWVHRLAPFLVVKWAVNKFADVKRHKAQTSTAAIIAGLVSFGFFYGLYVWIFHCFFGWHAAVWYALSLPLAGMVAHYYARNLRVLAGGLRDVFVLMRAPSAARRLRAMRGKLVEEIEAVRPGIRAKV